MPTQLIAELATNWAGNVAVAHDMIRSAADHGAAWVKVQLFDAEKLHKDDPQRDWLAHSQIDRAMLDAFLATAAKANIKLTASVFGDNDAMMAHAAGLTTIKIGSGNVDDVRLRDTCGRLFRSVWASFGLFGAEGTASIRASLPPSHVPFYGVSQYPTPYFRALARLTQADKSGTWGWSDHGEDLEVAKEAILYGASYVEVHYTLGIGKGCRHDAWDRDRTQLQQLRDFAESCAWEPGIAAYDDAVKKFVGRWDGVR